MWNNDAEIMGSVGYGFDQFPSSYFDPLYFSGNDSPLSYKYDNKDNIENYFKKKGKKEHLEAAPTSLPVPTSPSIKKGGIESCFTQIENYFWIVIFIFILIIVFAHLKWQIDQLKEIIMILLIKKD